MAADRGNGEMLILGALVAPGIEPQHGRVRTALGVLALAAGSAVSVASIAEVLWGSSQPAHPAKAVQVVLSRLRTSLAGSSVRIETANGGYRLVVSDNDFDAARFGLLVQQGNAAATDQERIGALGRALSLWRGPVLADLPELAHHPRITRLEEERLAAARDWAETALRLGRAADVVLGLGPLCEANPYREDLWHLQVDALADAGRVADALTTHAAVVERFRRDLDLLPAEGFLSMGAELRDRHQVRRAVGQAEITAGRLSLAVASTGSAVAHHRRALRQIDREDSAERVAVLIGLGRALRDAGEAEHTVVLAEAMGIAERLDDADLALHAAVAMRPAGWISDVGATDLAYCERLRRVLRRTDGHDDARRSVVQADLAGALLHTTAGDERIELFETALAGARRNGSPVVLRRVLVNALVLDDRSLLDRRLALAQELVELSAVAGDLESWCFGAGQVCLAAIEGARADLIDPAARQVRELADRLGNPLTLWGATSLEATIALLHGRLAEAERLADAALRLGVGTGATEGRALALFGGHLFEIRRLQGRDEGLIEAMGAMIDQQPDYPLWQAGALVMDAVLRPDEDTATRVRQWIADRGPFSRGMGWGSEVAAVIESAGFCGLVDEQLLVAEMCRGFGERMTFSGSATSGPVALFLGKAHAAVGDRATARAHFEAAVNLCRSLDAPTYEALAHLDLARLADSEGEPESVLRHATRARDLARPCGAGAITADASALLLRA